LNLASSIVSHRIKRPADRAIRRGDRLHLTDAIQIT
jgi:hypothetical protein